MVGQQHDRADAGDTAPRAGAEVISSDNERIGTVKESDDRHFKVNVRWQRDYWLNCALIRTLEGDRVVLSVPHDLLAGYKLHRTGKGFEPLVGGAEAKVADQGRPDL